MDKETENKTVEIIQKIFVITMAALVIWAISTVQQLSVSVHELIQELEGFKELVDERFDNQQKDIESIKKELRDEQ